MEDKEKALEQLSGRVTESQKLYFNNEIEGSFSDKVAAFIQYHKANVKDNDFGVEANKTAIKQALNVIVKNMETIEINAKNYVQNIRDDIGTRIAGLEENADELSNALSENKALNEINQDLSSRIDKLANEHRDLIDELTSEKLNAGINYDKLKKEYEELNQNYMKFRIQFGDMKDDLTRKNISLTEILNKLKEEHNQEVSKLKEYHAAEFSKSNKESQDLINGVSRDYTGLKIKTDETISKLEKELAIANATVNAHENTINRLENENKEVKNSLEKEREHIDSWLGPIARENMLKAQKLEKVLKDNGIELEEDK